MPKLLKMTDARTKRITYVNPDHIVAIQRRSGGIVFAVKLTYHKSSWDSLSDDFIEVANIAEKNAILAVFGEPPQQSSTESAA